MEDQWPLRQMGERAVLCFQVPGYPSNTPTVCKGVDNWTVNTLYEHLSQKMTQMRLQDREVHSTRMTLTALNSLGVSAVWDPLHACLWIKHVLS